MPQLLEIFKMRLYGKNLMFTSVEYRAYDKVYGHTFKERNSFDSWMGILARFRDFRDNANFFTLL